MTFLQKSLTIGKGQITGIAGSMLDFMSEWLISANKINLF